MRTLMMVCMVPVVLLVGGCSKSNPANPVNSLSAPVITQQPQSNTVSVGQSVRFTVTATGNPAPSYQWRRNGTNVPGTSFSYTISSVRLSDAGTYSVVVSNSEGSDTSNGAVLTVNATVTPTGMDTIPGGTFQMGDTDTNFPDEQPVHSVTLSAFYMDKTEVTQADYQALMLVNPSYFKGDSLRPVENVTSFDAVLYCNARSKRDLRDTVYSYTSKTMDSIWCTDLVSINIDYSKNGYRLPTEAEWEYACRAGTTTDYYWGRNYPPTTTADTAAIDSFAIWWHNSNNFTARVGTKLPNAFGLYDMSGNVWEWCNDWHDNYTSGNQTDPTGPSTGSYRVMRGGSYDDCNPPEPYVFYLVYPLCSANRGNYIFPYFRGSAFGFRCVRR
jgi:sulfatase modifying factor 1